MNPDLTPKPVSPKAPSPSTYASVGLGPIIAMIFSWVLGECCTIVIPEHIEAGIAALISGVIGYFFLGGKREDVS